MKLPSFNPYLGNETKPVGLARYLDTFFMNIGQLLVCNLLFVVCSLPIITIGPGLIALSRVSCSALRGKHISPVADFFAAFKSNFKAGVAVSFALVPLYLWLFYLGSAAAQNYLETGMGLGQFLVLLVGFVAVNCFQMYLLPLLAYMKADGITVLRNAFLLCFAGGGYTLFGGISAGALFVAGVMTLPKSLPLIITIFFSFLAYHSAFFGWKIADKYIFTPYYEEHPQQSMEDHY